MIGTRLHAWSDYAVPAGIAALSLIPGLGPLRALTLAGPVYHLGYTLLSRHEGGIVPVIPMRTHLVFDTAGALAFVGAGVLARRQPAWQRLLFAAIGVTELVEVAFSEDRDPPCRHRARIAGTNGFRAVA